MNYSLFLPPDHLKNLIKCFWVLESTEEEKIPNEYYLMADASAELVFQFNGGFQHYEQLHAYLRPQHNLNEKLKMGNKIGMFGARLYPHTVQLLTGLPIEELVNSVLDLGQLLKEPAVTLTEQVIATSSIHKRISIVADFITKQLYDKKADPIYQIAIKAIQCNGQLSLDHMRSATALSVRQFERRFKSTTGFTPKYYNRIVRFQASKQKYVLEQFTTLSQLSYACSYYDQSHFIKEFKEFSGIQAHHYFNIINKGDHESKAIKELLIAKDLPIKP